MQLPGTATQSSPHMSNSLLDWFTQEPLHQTQNPARPAVEVQSPQLDATLQSGHALWLSRQLSAPHSASRSVPMQPMPSHQPQPVTRLQAPHSVSSAQGSHSPSPNSRGQLGSDCGSTKGQVHESE